MGLFGVKSSGQPQPTNHVTPKENTPPVTSTAPKTQAELRAQVVAGFALKAEAAELRAEIAANTKELELSTKKLANLQEGLDDCKTEIGKIQSTREKALALKAARQQVETN